MKKVKDEYIIDCLRGEKLYGDDFDIDEISRWYRDEEEYFKKIGGQNPEGSYAIHELNKRHLFRHLPNRKTYKHAIGLGSQRGSEFLPIIDLIEKITIVEPADEFWTKSINNVPVKNIKPNINAELSLEDEEFDLILCFGTLHHIPNVSKVMKELYRCCSKGGYALIREPIGSMGDWRKPRKNATKRERGIPLNIFRKIIINTGFEIIRETKCIFSILAKFGWWPYNIYILVLIDEVFSRLFSWNYKYYARYIYQKIRPGSVSYVLKKK